jgi:hypothetical protein
MEWQISRANHVISSSPSDQISRGFYLFCVAIVEAACDRFHCYCHYYCCCYFVTSFDCDAFFFLVSSHATFAVAFGPR